MGYIGSKLKFDVSCPLKGKVIKTHIRSLMFVRPYFDLAQSASIATVSPPQFHVLTSMQLSMTSEAKYPVSKLSVAMATKGIMFYLSRMTRKVGYVSVWCAEAYSYFPMKMFFFLS